MHSSIKQNFIPIVAATMLATASTVMMISYVDPYNSERQIHILFYILIFCSTLGWLMIANFLIRTKILPDLTHKHISNSFRQSVIISLMFTFSLILNASGIMSIWIAIAIIISALVIEIFLNASSYN